MNKSFYKQTQVSPEFYIIEPTRRCNYSCFMCPNRFYSPFQKDHMKIDVYINILKNIRKYAKSIQLYWMGEPFINPNIITMIELAKKYTLANITISTNGSLLNKNLVHKLINCGLNKLIIDIDSGSSPEIYSMIRSGGSFAQLIENVEYLLNINNGINIVLQFLQFNDNISDLTSFRNKWKQYNCSLCVDWIDTWANQMPELREKAFALSPYEFEIRQPCSDLWHRVTINYLGEVNLCCHDFKGLYNFGNLAFENIETIWNNKNLIQIRESQLLGKFTGLCENCIEWAKFEEYEAFCNGRRT